MADRPLSVDIVVRQPHHEAPARALAAGLQRHGIPATISPNLEGPAPIAACWGWKIGRRMAAAGRRVLVMELGYVGDRMAWISLAWDGLNGRGKVPPTPDAGERWERHFARLRKPWRVGGQGCAVVVMGQVNGDASIDHTDIGTWYAQALEAAKRYDLPVLFRAHPLADDVPQGVEQVRGSLASTLESARVVITYNSNSGVDAALAGVPVIACDEGSMAWPVAGHGLESETATPDRSAWCASLAWRQWTPDEISKGDAWAHIRKGL